MRTSFHHQPEAQHPKSSAIHKKTPADYPIFSNRPIGVIRDIRLLLGITTALVTSYFAYLHAQTGEHVQDVIAQQRELLACQKSRAGDRACRY